MEKSNQNTGEFPAVVVRKSREEHSIVHQDTTGKSFGAINFNRKLITYPRFKVATILEAE